MTTLVVYHQGCADGSFAAAIIALAFPTDAKHYLPAVYSKDNGDIVNADGIKLDELTGIFDYERVIVVDFSFTERQMAVFTQHYKGNFKVLDHHNVRTHELYKAECAKLGDVTPLPLVFTAAGSGALLAYLDHVTQFLNSGYVFVNNIIRIAQLVSDRDCWRRSNKRAFAFYEGYSKDVFSEVEKSGVIFDEMPPTVKKAFDIIVDGNIETIIADGFKNIVERDEKIKHLIDTNSVFAEPNDLVPVKHAVVPCDKGIASELGTHVYENYAHFQTVLLPRLGHREPSRVFVSVRSSGYTENVAGSAKHIAQSQGGEGHINAAGFNMDAEEFKRLYPDLNLAFDSVGCDC